MAQTPPPPPPTPPQPPTSPQPGPPTPPQLTPTERVRLACQRRNETDYIFDYWTALGWTLLTFGVYGFYVFYQLIRRSRDHNARRLELLDAANAFAWEQAQAQGKTEELRPRFERVQQYLAPLRQLTTEFRDPLIWLLIYFVSSGIAAFIGFYLLDKDLIAHDSNEGGAEEELAQIFAALGHPLPHPDPGRVKGPHNIAGRIVATIFSLGIYFLWWYYNMFDDENSHFRVNWPWEDALAGAVQSMSAPT